MISGPCHPLVVGKKVVTRHSTLHWLGWLDRRKRECWCACVPLCTCICMYVCAHTCVLSGEASHALFVINFFLIPYVKVKWRLFHFCFGILILKSWLLLLLHVTSIHVARTAYIQHQCFMNIGEAIAVRHNAYFRWHMTDVFGDLGLLCTCNIHLLPESWSFPHCTD